MTRKVTVNVATLFQHDVNTEAIALGSSHGLQHTRTHRDLMLNVQQIGSALQRVGAREKDFILVMADTRPQIVEAILAGVSIGATVVPISPLTGTRNLSYIAERLQASYCVFDGSLRPESAAVLETHCRALVSLVATRNDPRPSTDPASAHSPDIDEDRLALIVHTSGSEGRPKAVRFTHGDLRLFVEHNQHLHSQFDDVDTGRPIVSVLPLSHFGGLALCLHGLMSKRPVYLMEHFLPDVFLKLIERARCSTIMLVPSMYRSLLCESSLARTDLSALNFCIAMGEPCGAELVSRVETAFGARMVSAYGLSECLTGIGHLKRDLLSGNIKAGSCGKRCFGEVKLVNSCEAPRTDFGELWVRNSTVHACYLDDELNEGHIRDGWFRTKDLFEKDADGFFFHRGRLDDMFIYNGRNIYPAELEAVLIRHPAVERVCAAPVLTIESTCVPAVLILTTQPLTEAEIMAFAARNGGGHAVPQMVVLCSSIPLTHSGKIDRSAAGRLLQSVYDERFKTPCAARESVPA